MASEAIIFFPFFNVVHDCRFFYFFLFGSPDIDGQFAFSGVLSQNLLLLLYCIIVLFGFVTK